MVQKEPVASKLFILICSSEIVYLFLARLGSWNDHLPAFLSAFLIAFIIYGFAVYLITRHVKEIQVRWIFLAAIVFRLTIIWNPPSLSEDFYRYLWDGRTQAAGFHPYDYAPQSPQLQNLRDQNYEKINHKEFPTIYPPLAENLFLAFTKLSSNMLVFKFGILAFELLLIEALRRLLKKEQLPSSLLLIYAWHPLPVVEFAGSGHMDVISIGLLFVSFLLLTEGRKVGSGLMLAAATMTKFLPVLALPWMLKKGGWKLLLTLLVATCLLAAQFYTPDFRMFKSASTFYHKWWFNDSLFRILYRWLGGAEPARRFGMLATGITASVCLIRRYSIYRSFFIVYSTILLFSPVVHPWYLCWTIPFLVFHRNSAWLFFSGWIVVAYIIRYLYPTGVWNEPLWLRLLIYLPFYLLLTIEALLHGYKSITIQRKVEMARTELTC